MENKEETYLIYVLEDGETWTMKKPLADRIRPESLKDFLGQNQVIGEGKLLKKAIHSQFPQIL